MCSRPSSPALGGILLVWSYGEIAPGTVSVSAAIDILIIAVVGGFGDPIGPFIGALIYASSRRSRSTSWSALGLDGNRFRLLIGLGFLVIVFFSPDGVVGLVGALAQPARTGTRDARDIGSGGHG